MKMINLIARLGLCALVLSSGTMATLIVGETRGLALADLSEASVQVMAAAPGGEVLYAALDGGPQAAGIYRSEDKGGTWQLVGSGPGVAVNALAVNSANPQRGFAGDAILYAGTAGGPAETTHSLWRSYDGGRTWRPSVLDLPADPAGLLPAVSTLAVDPRQPGVLYVGTAGQGVYRFKAEPNGYGYELVGGISLYNAHVKRLVVGPDGRVYTLTNEGLFVSQGDTWQKLSLPEMAASLAVAPGDPKILYVGGVSTGMYRSTDGGRSWERVNTGLDMLPGAALRVTALAVDEEQPRHVVAAIAYGLGNQFTPGSVYESRDGGYSWARLSPHLSKSGQSEGEGLADANGVVTQLTLNRDVIYAATQSGLTRYGAPIESPRPIALSRLRSGVPVLGELADLSGVQVLILALTLVLAGLALAGRTEWVLKKKAHVVQH